MADILCLKGDAAFSNFRLQRLSNRLTAAVPDIERVSADYWHVVALRQPLIADERSKLGQLLEERAGPEAAGTPVGERFIVTPRVGTISPWSSKPTDIAWNCDLDAIERIERVIVFHVVLKGGRTLSADERRIVSGLL
ncbi:MAG: phosphoribosylformylglycinamidine synthase, partial [Betaproteobacteria bacterium]